MVTTTFENSTSFSSMKDRHNEHVLCFKDNRSGVHTSPLSRTNRPRALRGQQVAFVSFVLFMSWSIQTTHAWTTTTTPSSTTTATTSTNLHLSVPEKSPLLLSPISLSLASNRNARRRGYASSTSSTTTRSPSRYHPYDYYHYRNRPLATTTSSATTLYQWNPNQQQANQQRQALSQLHYQSEGAVVSTETPAVNGAEWIASSATRGTTDLTDSILQQTSMPNAWTTSEAYVFDHTTQDLLPGTLPSTSTTSSASSIAQVATTSTGFATTPTILQDKGNVVTATVLSKHDKTDLTRDHQASSSVKTDSSNIIKKAPSYRQLLRFGSTTLLIWLSEPLLSLVDTACVAASGSVAQLAALGPATSLMDMVLYMTYFLAIATTNQIATANAAPTTMTTTTSNGKTMKTARVNKYRQLQQLTSHILGVAVATGALVSLVVGVMSPLVLTPLLSESSSSAVNAAVQYCWIRGATAPLSVAGMVAQSCCLAVHDISTPVRAVLASVLVNTCGDLLLTPIAGMQGAAVATAIASATSNLILLQSVRQKMKQWRQRQLETETPAVILHNNNNNNNKGMKDLNKPIPFLSLPDRASFWNLLRLSVPLAFNMWAKMGCYTALTVKATLTAAGNVATLAAHNLLLRIFYLVGTFSDALGQMAQAQLPSFLPNSGHHDEEEELQEQGTPAVSSSSSSVAAKKEYDILLRRFFNMAFTIALSGAGLCFAFLTPFFSGGGNILQSVVTDKAVLQAIYQAGGYVGMALLLHPLIVLFESKVIANQQFGSLIRTYVMTLLAYTALMVQPSNSLAHVWKNLVVGFQATRLLGYAFVGQVPLRRVMRSVWRRVQPQSHMVTTTTTTTTTFDANDAAIVQAFERADDMGIPTSPSLAAAAAAASATTFPLLHPEQDQQQQHPSMRRRWTRILHPRRIVPSATVAP